MPTTAREIHNGQDVIDSRDVIARIDHLHGMLQDEYDANVCPDDLNTDPTSAGYDAATAATVPTFDQWLEDAGDYQDEATEYRALKALQDEAEGCADWTHGEALIADSYFEEYAQQLAEDIGAINRDATWPNDCIDWKRAAEQLQYDYSQVDFAGVTYWIRS